MIPYSMLEKGETVVSYNVRLRSIAGQGVAMKRRLLGILDLLEEVLCLTSSFVGRVRVVYDLESLANLRKRLGIFWTAARVAVGRHVCVLPTPWRSAGGLERRYVLILGQSQVIRLSDRSLCVCSDRFVTT